MEKEIIDLLCSSRKEHIQFWKHGTGWNILNKGSELFWESVPLAGLEGISEKIVETDRLLWKNFIMEYRECMEDETKRISFKEQRREIAVHMVLSAEETAYCNICCRIKRENENFESMLLSVRRLDAEELYRIRLAKMITNDKNPEFFMQGATDIMNRNPDKKYALIQFDILKFKIINEVYGEEKGDEILHFIIDTLKMVCTEEQLFTRLSADVFMVLTEYETKEDIEQFIHMLEEKLKGYDGISYSFVFGVCAITDRKKKLRSFGDSAAFARFSVKGNALNHIGYFEEKMFENARIGKFIEDHMEQALQDREFTMFLQPKYSISKNRMIGAEALVRWIHPERGMISPANFIPLFEKNGFIIKIDYFIWEEACRTIRKWMDADEEPLPISVNVSRCHLKNEKYLEVLNHLIEKYQIPKKYLELEITESVGEEGVEKGVCLLKENGFTLLMDDFGSGFSSLNMLKDTNFDVIKIDRGFLRNFVSSERGRKIVEHTIKMTNAIGLDMIAEGVETKEQAVFLSDCGCDKAQGFYYAKPMSLEELEKRRI